jgi:hypothetical protein
MTEQDRLPEQRGASRRALLGAVTLGAAGSIVGLPAVSASAHGIGVRTNVILNQLLYYQGANRVEEFNSTFYNRLETWLQFYLANTPGNWGTPIRINHLGVHVDKGGMHQEGRAIDLSLVQFTDANTRGLFNALDARNGSSTNLKWYWAGVAGLNYHTHYVLHYLYNSEHYNHVHADNQVSGGGNPSFSTGSRTQILAAQAALKYIWGYSGISVDGGWGPQTDSYSRQAIARAGGSNGLTTSGNWQVFNRATLRFGTGTQAY